MIFPFDIF